MSPVILIKLIPVANMLKFAFFWLDFDDGGTFYISDFFNQKL